VTRIDNVKQVALSSQTSVLKASWMIAAALLRQLSQRFGDRLARDLSR